MVKKKGSKGSSNKGKHMMPDGRMMSDTEMKKMMKKKRMKGY